MTGVESSFHILFDRSCGDLVCGTVERSVANKFDYYFHFDNEFGEKDVGGCWHSICVVFSVLRLTIYENRIC